MYNYNIIKLASDGVCVSDTVYLINVCVMATF